jgi:hypothetical protein
LFPWVLHRNLAPKEKFLQIFFHVFLWIKSCYTANSYRNRNPILFLQNFYESKEALRGGGKHVFILQQAVVVSLEAATTPVALLDLCIHDCVVIFFFVAFVALDARCEYSPFTISLISWRSQYVKHVFYGLYSYFTVHEFTGTCRVALTSVDVIRVHWHRNSGWHVVVNARLVKSHCRCRSSRSGRGDKAPCGVRRGRRPGAKARTRHALPPQQGAQPPLLLARRLRPDRRAVQPSTTRSRVPRTVLLWHARLPLTWQQQRVHRLPCRQGKRPWRGSRAGWPEIQEWSTVHWSHCRHRRDIVIYFNIYQHIRARPR